MDERVEFNMPARKLRFRMMLDDEIIVDEIFNYYPFDRGFVANMKSLLTAWTSILTSIIRLGIFEYGFATAKIVLSYMDNYITNSLRDLRDNPESTGLSIDEEESGSSGESGSLKG